MTLYQRSSNELIGVCACAYVTLMLVQGCDSNWRGRCRHHVSAAVISAQGVFLLQPQDNGHMGRTWLLAVQAEAQA